MERCYQLAGGKSREASEISGVSQIRVLYQVAVLSGTRNQIILSDTRSARSHYVASKDQRAHRLSKLSATASILAKNELDRAHDLSIDRNSKIVMTTSFWKSSH